MDDKNISEKIRKYILEKCNLINDVFDNVTIAQEANILFNSINNFEGNNKVHLLSGYNIPDIFDFSTLRGVAMFLRIQMYTDYYRSAKLQDQLYGTRMIDTFPKIKSYNDIKKFCNNNNMIQFGMLDSVREYNESSEFDKVLFSKCLDEKNIKYLKSINPFFEYENNTYNIKVNLEFIFKQIEEMQKKFPMDIDLSYDAASRFIFDLYKLNKTEAENLLLDLFREDLGIISSVSTGEDFIQMGQVNINIDNLALMFKDYYKFKKKVSGKRR